MAGEGLETVVHAVHKHLARARMFGHAGSLRKAAHELQMLMPHECIGKEALICAFSQPC